MTGADLVDDTLFLRRTTQRGVRERLWTGWIWLRRGLWLQVVLWREREEQGRRK